MENWNIMLKVSLISYIYAKGSCQYEEYDNCGDYKCTVPIHLRQDCSKGELSRDQCRAKGCCFDNSRFNTTWCFQPLRLSRGKCPHMECQVIPENREQCWNEHNLKFLTEQRCLAMGCCYDDDNYGNPVCFKRKVYPIAHPGLLLNSCVRMEPGKRRMCGQKDASIDQCLRWRCCSLPFKLEGPQCFYPM